MDYRDLWKDRVNEALLDWLRVRLPEDITILETTNGTLELIGEGEYGWFTEDRRSVDWLLGALDDFNSSLVVDILFRDYDPECWDSYAWYLLNLGAEEIAVAVYKAVIESNED